MTLANTDLAALFMERWRSRAASGDGQATPPPQSTEDVASLRQTLDQGLERAREAFPGVALTPERFVSHLADKVPTEAGLDGAVAALSSLRHPELYLAAACAEGDPKALSTFEERYAGELLAAVPRQGDRARLAGEVKQILFAKLFVRDDDAAPKILDYAGRGELGGFVRVAAGRTALNLLRSEKRRSRASDAVADVPLPFADPELAHVESLHRDDFRSALQEAAAALSVRERNLLRQHHIDGLTMDQLARLYGLHRVTVIRNLQAAREKLAQGTRRNLKVRLRIGERELESLLRVVDSRLDLSIRRYLA